MSEDLTEYDCLCSSSSCFCKFKWCTFKWCKCVCVCGSDSSFVTDGAQRPVAAASTQAQATSTEIATLPDTQAQVTPPSPLVVDVNCNPRRRLLQQPRRIHFKPKPRRSLQGESRQAYEITQPGESAFDHPQPAPPDRVI